MGLFAAEVLQMSVVQVEVVRMFHRQQPLRSICQQMVQPQNHTAIGPFSKKSCELNVLAGLAMWVPPIHQGIELIGPGRFLSRQLKPLLHANLTIMFRGLEERLGKIS